MSDELDFVVQTKPCLVSLKAGKKYAWCTCKFSKDQPWCDGSHKGTDKRPMVFTADKDEDVLLCACKETKSSPYCDGSHNNLEDEYAEASPEEVELLKDSVFVEQENGKAVVDGGAYVLTPLETKNNVAGTLKYQPVIAKEDGATKLSLHRLVAAPGTSPWVQYEGVDTAIYIVSGSGIIDIAGKEFSVRKDSGIFVKTGEAFRVLADEEMVLFATACPLLTDLTVLDENNTTFDETQAERYVPFEEEKATVMANRIYQELVDTKVGCQEITQFVGQIPKSRAAMHRHLYEEAIIILTGFGRMWTGTKWAEVKTGDVLFLPHRQGHSVECTDENGMLLMGVFYPSGSPAINY